MSKHGDHNPDLEERGRSIVQRLIGMSDRLLEAADELKALADSVRQAAPGEPSRPANGR